MQKTHYPITKRLSATEKISKEISSFTTLTLPNSIHVANHPECLRATVECLEKIGEPVSVVLRKLASDEPFFYTDWEFTAINRFKWRTF